MKIKPEYLDNCFQEYIACALWSSVNENDTPLDSIDANIHPDTLSELREELRDFIEGISEPDLIEYLDCQSYAHLGYDFWLTRNGHGAGFWDRGLGDLGERLTEAAKVYGGVDLYVGDDGRIYN